MNKISLTHKLRLKDEIKNILEEKDTLMHNLDFMVNGTDIENCINEINRCDTICKALYERLNSYE